MCLLEFLNQNSGAITAIFTVILTIVTYKYVRLTSKLARDSSKNIEVSKNSLIKEDLKSEMEQLIKPLYDKRDQFGYYEVAYAFNSPKDNFWKEMENNKYLATKDLRESIENYLKESKELRQTLSAIQSKIRAKYQKERKQLPDNFLMKISEYANLSSSYCFINVVPPELNKLLEELNEESEIRSDIEKYIFIVENNDLAITRSNLRNKVIERYEKLEKKIDEIRESLEKT